MHKTSDDINQELGEIKAAQQDRSRFEVLYNRYYEAIFRFVHHRVHDESTTSDITSQVFLKGMINIQRYEFKGVPFSAWLYRIAANEINMYFRKRQSAKEIHVDENDLKEIMVHELEEKEVTEEKINRMMQVMEKLEDHEVILIEMRFFEKRSFQEIGMITGITENNAKVKTYRALDKLKALMK